MKRVWSLLVFVAIAAASPSARSGGCSAPETVDGVEADAGAANLPADAAAVVERLSSCNHFAGEFNGDGSEHDREVNATMTGLRCDTVEADAEAMRAKYADSEAVLDALEAADEY